MSTAPQLHLNITAGSAAELLAQARAISGSAGLGDVSTDALLVELRERMAKQSPVMVVKVEPFASDDEQPRTEPARTTRQRKPREDKPAASTVENPGTVDVPREEPKEIVAGTQADAAGATATDEWSGGDETPKTIDDVKAALNECAAVHGQASTREVMQKHGGARLMDVKAEQYGALIAALKAKAAQKPATQAQAA